MFCFCKQKMAYELRISDWSSDVCSSDLSVIRILVEDMQFRPPDPFGPDLGRYEHVARGTSYTLRRSIVQAQPLAMFGIYPAFRPKSTTPACALPRSFYVRCSAPVPPSPRQPPPHRPSPRRRSPPSTSPERCPSCPPDGSR